jgi:hypothetical protein
MAGKDTGSGGWVHKACRVLYVGALTQRCSPLSQHETQKV